MSKNYSDKFLKLQMPDTGGGYGNGYCGEWDESHHWNSLCQDLANLWEIKDEWRNVGKFRKNMPKIYALLKEMEGEMASMYNTLVERDYPKDEDEDTGEEIE